MQSARYHVTISNPATGEVIETLELDLDKKPDRLVICACDGPSMTGEQPCAGNQVDYFNLIGTTL